MYYYFTGSYIQRQLPPTLKTEKIKMIFSDLSQEINFNIALFLAYNMNVEYEILPQIKEATKQLLVDYENFEYTQQRDLLKKLEYEINNKVDKMFNIPLNANIPKIQEEKALKSDELIDDLDTSKTSNVNDNDEEFDQMTQEFTKSVRIIEFLGDILKNYSSSIKRKPRIEIIELMYTFSMRLMGALYNSLNGMIDTIIDIVDEKAKEDNEEIAARSQLKQKINEFLGEFWTAFVGVNISNLGFSLQTDRINKEILDVKNDKNCTFFDLTTIDYLIRTQNGRLPVKLIEECVKGKNKLDTFSLNVLSQNVAIFLRNYQFNDKDKKSVCSLFKFNIKDVLIDEQKNKSLSEL